MAIRLANMAHHTLLNSHLFKLQQNLFDSQMSVATEKKTQDYMGIPDQSGRVVQLEHLAAQSQRFIDNNEVVDLRLQSTDIALVGVEDTIRNMYDMISDYGAGERRDAEQVEQVQKFAYQALRDIQGFLNETVAGRYLFSGSRTAQRSVDLGLGKDIAEFQEKWNGDTLKYPESRDAHIAEFGVSADFDFTLGGTGNNQYMEIDISSYAAADYSNFTVGADIELSDTANDGRWTVTAVDTTTGYIRVARKDFTDETSSDTFTIKKGSDRDTIISDSMTYSGNTITAASGAGTFNDIEIPATLEIASGSGNNNMTVTISSVSADGSSLTVEQKTATAGTNDTGTITMADYYGGDQMEIQHRIDKNRTIDLDTNALNPAFDKAIRGLAIIAQGEFGSAGGLDQNTGRTEDALWLLDSALDFPTDGTPPYGTEETDSIEQLRFNGAFARQQIKSSIEREEDMIGYLLNNVSNIEDVDMLEATTGLMDIERALQASYQVLSRTQKLNLSQYL
ncbi:flagellin [Terasakiella sp. SH-1]|uniref:flagellin n=1 Tax=Terasakiella sp. SH-1 TaxID=2560057 RepID=UPI00107429EC|nr:flagellin [Terasakiella sp. SH-1]